MQRALPTLTPWAWGVNGFFTVLGSVSAVILGMAFGFTVVLATAGLCYIAGFVAIGWTPGARVRTTREDTRGAELSLEYGGAPPSAPGS